MFETLAALTLLTAAVMVVKDRKFLNQPIWDKPTPRMLGNFVSDVLTKRRNRVYRLMLQMSKENNQLKMVQAQRLLRMIDNKLAQVSYKNLFIYN